VTDQVTPELGQIWRDGASSVRYVIIGADERFGYVKRADTPKRSWTRAGSYPVALSEFSAWTLLEEPTPSTLEMLFRPGQFVWALDHDDFVSLVEIVEEERERRGGLRDPAGEMLIGYDGEAYETFQRAIASMPGYGVTITPVEGDPFEAVLVGSDPEAEDGATVRYARADEDGNYPPVDELDPDRIESAVVSRIQVG
jgi:hypothetical protein